jgi:Na+/melibiose symporter-like transporter
MQEALQERYSYLRKVTNMVIFLCAWLIPLFLSYLLLRYDLKHNPDAVDGSLIGMVIWMLIPVFNVILLIVTICFIFKYRLNERKVADIIFLIRRKEN